jgi:hypothetical protein
MQLRLRVACAQDHREARPASVNNPIRIRCSSDRHIRHVEVSRIPASVRNYEAPCDCILIPTRCDAVDFGTIFSRWTC